MRAPSERSWLDKTLSRRHLGRVTEFLEYLSRRSPQAIASLNQEAVSWWWGSRTKRGHGRAGSSANGRWRYTVMVMLVFFLGIPVITNLARQTPSVPERAYTVRPPPPPPARADETRRSLLDRLPADATETQRRYAARRDCKDAVGRLGNAPPSANEATALVADIRCRKILEMTPDSLLMRQYAGIAALRLGEAKAAHDQFTAILKDAPDDAYALFGKGLVSTISGADSDLGKAKDMADALALNADVAPYYAGFGLEVADLEPSARKPRSKLPKLESIRAETEAERLENADALDGQGLSDHFGLDDTTAGEVVLECIVNIKGRAAGCHIKSEEPANVGLGEVGLLAMKDIRYKPPTTNGEPVGGMPLTYTLTYSVEPPPATDAPK